MTTWADDVAEALGPYDVGMIPKRLARAHRMDWATPEQIAELDRRAKDCGLTTDRLIQGVLENYLEK